LLLRCKLPFGAFNFFSSAFVAHYPFAIHLVFAALREPFCIVIDGVIGGVNWQRYFSIADCRATIARSAMPAFAISWRRIGVVFRYSLLYPHGV
jgi:hypothetical protein